MSLSKAEARQLFQRLIFEESDPREWAQDIWDMNPVLGENAARLLEAFEASIECCPQEQLENLVEGYLSSQMAERN